MGNICRCCKRSKKEKANINEGRNFQRPATISNSKLHHDVIANGGVAIATESTSDVRNGAQEVSEAITSDQFKSKAELEPDKAIEGLESNSGSQSNNDTPVSQDEEKPNTFSSMAKMQISEEVKVDQECSPKHVDQQKMKHDKKDDEKLGEFSPQSNDPEKRTSQTFSSDKTTSLHQSPVSNGEIDPNQIKLNFDSQDLLKKSNDKPTNLNEGYEFQGSGIPENQNENCQKSEHSCKETPDQARNAEDSNLLEYANVSDIAIQMSRENSSDYESEVDLIESLQAGTDASQHSGIDDSPWSSSEDLLEVKFVTKGLRIPVYIETSPEDKKKNVRFC